VITDAALPGPRDTLCCTRYPVNTFTWPLSVFVGRGDFQHALGRPQNLPQARDRASRNSAATSRTESARCEMDSGPRGGDARHHGRCADLSCRWLWALRTVAIGVRVLSSTRLVSTSKNSGSLLGPGFKIHLCKFALFRRTKRSRTA